MTTIDAMLQDAMDVIKIIAIPVIGFFCWEFYKGVKSLKKSVDQLIIQMKCRETYCIEKHKDIEQHLCRHDKDISALQKSETDHGERISKFEGQLKK